MKIKAYLDNGQLIRVENFFPDFCEGISLYDENGPIDFKARFTDNGIELITKEVLDYRNEYFLILNKEKVKVERREILHLKRFDEEYVPDLNTLGSFIEDNSTIFRFWAPFSNSAELIIDGKSIPMERKEKGVYELKINRNLDKVRYHYILNRESERISFLDPFAYVKDFNDIDSIVIDRLKIKNRKVLPAPYDFPVIYETSVRDFSIEEGLFHYPGKFLAFKENGLEINGKPIGTDYLKSLGITHLQLMPVLDYDNDGSAYNWGYNPLHYNVFKDEYLVSNDPYEKIKEVQSVFSYLHSNNIRVILDVVFNHVYSLSSFDFNRILPHYFFRYQNGRISDGAGLSNELRTESRFLREYLVLMMKRLVEIYDIDGLRYDLAGLVDITTMKDIRSSALNLKPDFITIAEGWKMGDTLSKEEACNYENADRFKECIFFSPELRDLIRGTYEKKGLIEGELKDRNLFEQAFMGNGHLNSSQTLNYTECHDNATVFDYIKRKCPNESDFEIQRRARFALGLVLLSKGIPFVHSGQEFYRTKGGLDNTYNQPDEINHLDWRRCSLSEDSTKYLKELISLRKDLMDYYRMEWKSYEYYEMSVFEIKDLNIFVNACPFHHIYTDGNEYDTVFDGEKRTSIRDSGVNVEPYSIVIAFKKL